MKRASLAVLTTAAIASHAAGCSCRFEDSGIAPRHARSALSGKVAVDGSSTVYPIMEAVAEEFRSVHPDIRVTVGIAGTGGGFKKFAAGEIDVCDASRPIRETERQACASRAIEYLELKIAYDGLSVVVNPQNNWADCLTVERLKELWRPGSSVRKWSDLDRRWPDAVIKLYGPGTDSGTFDYFTAVICGQEKASRSDYTASEDDNVLLTGIAADKYGLGYVGYAYYAENQARLKLLGVDDGTGGVKPSAETVRNGEYQPLTRPLFIYVKRSSLARPEVAAVVRFTLANSEQLVTEVKYVPVPPDEARHNVQKLEAESRGL